MNKQTRTYEEIITLQDKAIEALTQANAALLLALEALKKARAEHGFTVQLPGLGQGLQGDSLGIVNPTYTKPVYVPNTTDGVQWHNGQTTGLMTLTNTAGSYGSSQLAAKTVTAQSIISQANSQKELANAYISGYQAWQAKKEQDEVSQVGGCL